MMFSGVLVCLCSLIFSPVGARTKKPLEHPLPRSLPESKINDLAQKTDYRAFYDGIFLPVLRVRVPGTKGHHAVKLFIKKQFEDLDWTVTLDEFDDMTPYGPKRFTNVIATLNPNAKRRLILAAHYDSKYFPEDSDGRYFFGATDSAMPCAMLIEIAKTVTPLFKAQGQRQDRLVSDDDDEQSDVTLQMVFFDGEEAFKEWTKNDSLYGSRHLAEVWSNTTHPKGSDTTMINTINALVLLDLIGTSDPQPTFYNTFKETDDLFKRLEQIERRLISTNRLIERRPQPYFMHGLMDRRYLVEDDHIPFLERNVKILHLISLPFPNCWHQVCDHEGEIDPKVVQDLLKVLQVFVVEYFGLAVV